MKLKVYFEDQSIIVVEKPAGIESQSAKGFGADMVSEIKKHIHKLSPSNRELYVGVIHRLDKPVQGMMVYAKTKKAAAALSKQVQQRTFTKTYEAVICGKPVDNVGKYVDYLLKDGKTNYTQVVDKSVEGCKTAELSYQVLGSKEIQGQVYSLVRIQLLTGRHHQIRVQFASRGLPLAGDQKYGKMENNGGESSYIIGNQKRGLKETVALCSTGLSFYHPVSGKKMEFQEKPEGKAFSFFD